MIWEVDSGIIIDIHHVRLSVAVLSAWVLSPTVFPLRSKEYLSYMRILISVNTEDGDVHEFANHIIKQRKENKFYKISNNIHSCVLTGGA